MYEVLIQSSLLSENGAQITELSAILNTSRSTAEKRLRMVDDNILVVKVLGKTKYYSADIEQIDKLINDSES